MKQETIDRIRKFTEDRDWDQFHSPANLAKSIVIEAAELLECFQWNDEAKREDCSKKSTVLKAHKYSTFGKILSIRKTQDVGISRPICC